MTWFALNSLLFLIPFATSLFGDLLAQCTAVMGEDTCRSPLFYWDKDDGDKDEDGDVSFIKMLNVNCRWG